MAGGRRLVQVGFMRRYDDGYRAMKRAVDEGRIGTPLLAHCVHRNAASPAFFTSDMPVTDSAVHEMDIIRWLLGDEVTALSVLATRRSGYAPEQSLQDLKLLLMETAAGVHVDVEVFVNCQYGYDVRCELVGETWDRVAAQPGRRAAQRRHGQPAGALATGTSGSPGPATPSCRTGWTRCAPGRPPGRPPGTATPRPRWLRPRSPRSARARAPWS